MDAVEFIKKLNKICEESEDCRACPFFSEKCSITSAPPLTDEDIRSLVRAVENYNPNTRQSEFLKHYPDEKTDTQGALIICPMEIDDFNPTVCLEYHPNCKQCKHDYWLHEV